MTTTNNGNNINDGNDNDYSTDNGRLFQTTLRENITPYLPPPVIKAIKEIDPLLEPIVGPEASVNIFGSLLLAWLLYQLARTVFSSGSSLESGDKNTAIQEDERDQDILPSNAETSRPFDETVLLCGPSLAGKTSIFYRLLQRDVSSSTIGTVRSIKSNTGFLETSEGILRILDTPGHWGPQKLLRVVGLQNVQRLVVVVDSSQPIPPAADYLYAVIKFTLSNSTTTANSSPSILIACHKNDHAKAKNARRIKLQLRSELIRLGKLDKGGETENDKSVNWEETMNAIPICSTNVADLKQLRDFCETGTPPSSSTKR
jgi:signal recognition particle receptor subunit beta